MQRPSSIFYIRRRKKIIGTEYWTGKSWSTWLCFAKPYSLGDAAEVMTKRFHRADPRPKIIGERFARE